jgi:hypothetical protein
MLYEVNKNPNERKWKWKNPNRSEKKKRRTWIEELLKLGEWKGITSHGDWLSWQKCVWKVSTGNEPFLSNEEEQVYRRGESFAFFRILITRMKWNEIFFVIFCVNEKWVLYCVTVEIFIYFCYFIIFFVFFFLTDLIYSVTFFSFSFIFLLHTPR